VTATYLHRRPSAASVAEKLKIGSVVVLDKALHTVKLFDALPL
jgi:hypothetical protein